MGASECRFGRRQRTGYTSLMSSRAGGPTITVVIPTMNQSQLLGRCLGALGQQTDRDFDVVVVDDGSTDDTVRQVTEHEWPFAWTLLSVANGGPARARNLGIRVADEERAARGEPATWWVAFLDDDVVPAPGWLAAIRREATAHPDAQVLVGRTTATTVALPTVFSHQLTVLSPPPGPFPTCNLAVRRDVFQRWGGFDRCFPYPAYEDTDWAVRVRRAGVVPRFVPAMAVDHPPRPSTLGGHLRRIRYQAAAVRFALKNGQPSALVGITDLMQYVGVVGTLVWLDQPWMWPFLAAWAIGLYVRATNFLALKRYTTRESLLALVVPLVTPWWKLGVYLRALASRWVWADCRAPHPSRWEEIGPLPANARLVRHRPEPSPVRPGGAEGRGGPATGSTPQPAPAPTTG